MNTVQRIYELNRTRPIIGKSLRTRRALPLSASISSRRSPAIIAEFKRISPSGFRNTKNRDVVEYLRKVKAIDPVGLSIITEPEYFAGSYQDLASAHEIGIPVLAKDFFATPGMVLSAFNSGADSILLIADFLNEATIQDLIISARNLGMDALVEFHDPGVMDRIPNIVGINVGYNRRNLRTMMMEDETDKIAAKLSKFVCPRVLESGLDYRNLPAEYLETFDAFLIGSSLLLTEEAFH